MKIVHATYQQAGSLEGHIRRVRNAIDQAERFQAELSLLKGLEPMGRILNLPPWTVREAEERIRKLAHEYLECALTKFAKSRT